jgi:hypothetical protein
MMFENPADYIEHCKSDPIPALPIPLIAEYLNITPAAVMGRAGRGTLELLEIGKTKMISVRSLLALNEEFERKVSVVRKELERLARRGDRRVFYEPIMTAVDLSWRVPAHRTEIGGVLGAVSEETSEEDGLMLSVLVHQKKAGRTMPGAGFFNLAKSLGFKWRDDHKFVEDQTDRVLAKFGTE